MSFHAPQFRDLVNRTLKLCNLWSPAAVELLMLTAAVESGLGTYLRQLGGGPALGVFQMEPMTHDDIHMHFVNYRHGLKYMVSNMFGLSMMASRMEFDLRYAIVMTRLHYLRVKDRLPVASDIVGLGMYWKQHYNTALGSGTVEKAVAAYERHSTEV